MDYNQPTNAKVYELYTITEIGGLYKFLAYMKMKFKMNENIRLEIEVEVVEEKHEDNI